MPSQTERIILGRNPDRSRSMLSIVEHGRTFLFLWADASIKFQGCGIAGVSLHLQALAGCHVVHNTLHIRKGQDRSADGLPQRRSNGEVRRASSTFARVRMMTGSVCQWAVQRDSLAARVGSGSHVIFLSHRIISPWIALQPWSIQGPGS